MKELGVYLNIELFDEPNAVRKIKQSFPENIFALS
jgi:hypothetical protein